MRLRDHPRPAATLLATLAVVVGLAACESSGADSESTPPAPASTETAPSETIGTELPTSATAEAEISDADVADLEKQLDEIDELLAGVDADLAQD
jgi:hypothetical protein